MLPLADAAYAMLPPPCQRCCRSIEHAAATPRVVRAMRYATLLLTLLPFFFRCRVAIMCANSYVLCASCLPCGARAHARDEAPCRLMARHMLLYYAARLRLLPRARERSAGAALFMLPAACLILCRPFAVDSCCRCSATTRWFTGRCVMPLLLLFKMFFHA